MPTVSKTYSYDETNWLSSVIDSVAGTTVTYQYDNNGNTVLKSDSSRPGEDMIFTYDSRNQLVETTQGATLLGRYDYDAQGLRIRYRSSERGDVDYFYDDGAVLEERLSSGSLLAHYRYADRLLSLSTGSETQYYHHDALGSTVDLTDGTGAVQTRYTLDPWGHIKSQIGSSVNRMIFTGQEHDEQTGLIYFGARYYDPDSARFITQDSYLGEPGTPPSLHRYLYAYANPTVYVDLMGYLSWDEVKDGAGRAWTAGKSSMTQLAQVLPGVTAKTNAAFDESLNNAYATGIENGVPLLDNDVSRGALTLGTTLTKGALAMGSAPLSKAVETIEYAKDPTQIQNFPIYASSVRNAFRASEAFAKDGSLENGVNLVGATGGAVLETAAIGSGVKALAEKPAMPKSGITVESRVAEARVEVADDILPDLRKGDKVYRVYGGDSRPDGASWTTTNPADVSNFRDFAGLPSGGESGVNNTGRFVIEGTIMDPSKVVLKRKALSIDGMKGGLDEYIIPKPFEGGAVEINRVSGVNPEF